MNSLPSRSVLGLAFVAVSSTAFASDSFFTDWFARVSATQAEQPHWVTPLATVTPRLEQEYRYDQYWQSSAGGHKLTSYGGGKGLELIPCENVEVILGVPAWQTRNIPTGTDGWADESVLLKYRILTGNEENGNYILTAFMGFGFPTGSAHNTTDHYTFTPTIAAGKGWGNFDVQTTLGITVPDNVGSASTTGSPITWNTALQYRLLKTIWPEVEANYTWWPNGTREGKNQLYITPGVVLGRFPVWERVGFTIGIGYQVAVTQRPLYGRNVILSARLPF